MADVFLSYNRNDRARIEPIASALGLLGVSVWYDARLQSGASFDEVIARELDDAALVVACWSPDSLASRWARSEALFALDQQKLAAVFLRPCKLSPPFNLIHAEDLADWEGQPGHHGFAKLVERIATALQRPGLAEMSEGVSGGDAALYGWARRYPEEPKAKEIWRLARSRHEAEFEAEVEAARAEIERLAATHKEAALAALASCRDGFESWIEAERIGAAIARPEPQASVQSLFASEESTAAKARAERLSRQFGEAEERLARIEKERDLHSAKAVAAEAALNTANAELGAARSEIRSTRDRFSKLQRDRDALAAKAQSVEAEAARLREALTKADAAAQTEKASRASKIEELEQAVTQARTRRDALTERLTGSATGAPNISEAGTIHGGRFSAPIGVAAIAFLWILAAVLGSSSQFVAAPGEVLSRLAQATLWSNAVRTLVDLASGATAGLLVTAAVAAAARWFKPARVVFVAILRVLAPLPLITPLPVFMTWYGNAIMPFLVVAFGTCMASAAMSVRGVDGPWGETYARAASFRANLKPMMRQCAALALLLAIASELVGGTSGIGAYALQDAIGISDVAAAVIVSAIMGFALDRAMGWLGGRLGEALTKAGAATQTEKASRASKIEELEQAVTQARTQHDALTRRLTGSATGAPDISEAGTIHGGRFSAPIGVAAIAFLWILAAVLGSSSQLVPAPGEVMSRLAQATLWSNAVRTLVDLAIGATAGLLVTAAVASAARWFKPARIVFVAILRVLAPLPLIMPLALFSMWFGNAILPFFVVAFGTCIASAAMSVRGVDGPWGETYVRAASFRASLKPMMRQCAALALLLTVASEMIGGTSGIGAYALQDAIGISDITAAVIVSAIMGFALDRAMAWLGGRLARSG